jgi:hypothetical protein
MRLPPFPGRVKFRSVYSFRLYFPALVERLPSLPIGSAAKVYQSEDDRSNERPPAACQEPGREAVAAADRALPLLLEAIDGETRCRENCGFEVLFLVEPSE